MMELETTKLFSLFKRHSLPTIPPRIWLECTHVNGESCYWSHLLCIAPKMPKKIATCPKTIRWQILWWRKKIPCCPIDKNIKLPKMLKRFFHHPGGIFLLTNIPLNANRLQSYQAYIAQYIADDDISRPNKIDQWCLICSCPVVRSLKHNQKKGGPNWPSISSRKAAYRQRSSQKLDKIIPRRKQRLHQCETL